MTIDWSPEPVDILYSTQLYERPPKRLAPVTAEPDPPVEEPEDGAAEVAAGAAGAWEPLAGDDAGAELEQPARATAIMTSMTAIRLILEYFIIVPRVKSRLPVPPGCPGRDAGYMDYYR